MTRRPPLSARGCSSDRVRRTARAGLIAIGRSLGTLGMALLLALAGAQARAAEARFDEDAQPIWKVADDLPIAPPSPSKWNEVASFVDIYWLNPLDDLFAVRVKPLALDVNSADDVPASSWFTPGKTGQPAESAAQPRVEASAPAAAQLPAGPLEIETARFEGDWPMLVVRDAQGARFLLEFDDPRSPELRTAASVIAARLLGAAGYPVLASGIEMIAPEDLRIGEGALEYGEHGASGKLQPEKLAQFLVRYAAPSNLQTGAASQAASASRALVRVAAGRLPEGRILGGFAPRGVRQDDPNDLIPHEARRSLRGLQPLAAWLDLTGIREDRTLDIYLEPEHHVRHYLSGLALALGNNRRPEGDAWRRFFPLHAFHPRLLDALKWQPDLLYAPFAEMNWGDGFWGARLLLSFTDAEIAAAVAAGRYSDPQVTEYVTGALQERRNRVGRAWIEAVNGADRFTIRQPAENRWSLECTDLGTSGGLRSSEDVFYLMTMRALDDKTALGYQSRGGAQPTFDLTPFAPGAWMHRQDASRYAVAEITSWDHTGRNLAGRALVHIYFDRASGPRVVGIIRD